MKSNARTLVAIVLVLMALLLFDQTNLTRMLATVQSIVIIVLGVTAILYLWKRL